MRRIRAGSQRRTRAAAAGRASRRARPPDRPAGRGRGRPAGRRPGQRRRRRGQDPAGHRAGARVAGRRGFTVLSGRCAELADTVPYLPLADALRDAATGPSARGPVLDALAARPVLSRLLPDRQPSEPDGADLPGLAQQQLFGAVLGMLAELAEAAPVLLVLEDLHWADRSTRDLVTFLSRVLHRERIALVATYRTDDMHRRHPLRPVVAELLRLPSVTAVDLRPAGLGRAMAEHLTMLSGGPGPAPVLDGLIDRAEGNAYYAEELLAAAARLRPARRGPAAVGWPCRRPVRAPAGRPTALPAGLADLLLARMERLSAAAQQVLRAAAVTGRHVDDELVMRASGLATAGVRGGDPRGGRPAAAGPGRRPRPGVPARAAARGHLRRPAAGGADPAARAAGRAAVRRAAAGRGPRLRRRAGLPRPGQPRHPGAFAASVQAGEEAERLAAPAEAHRHYDLALSLWERVSEPEKLGGIERGDLALRSALSAADAGDISRAAHQLRRLLELPAPRRRPGAASAGPTSGWPYFLLDLDEDAEALGRRARRGRRAARRPAQRRAGQRAGHPGPGAAGRTASPARPGPVAEQAAGRRPGGRRALGGRRRPGHAGHAGRARRPGQDGDRLLRPGAGPGPARQHARRRAAGRRSSWPGSTWSAATWATPAAPRTTASCAPSEAGLAMAPYGFDLQYLHYLAHYADGRLGPRPGDRRRLRGPGGQRGRGPAVGHGPVHRRGPGQRRGRPAACRGWSRSWHRDQFVEYIARGLLAEHAYWQGDIDTALAQSEATVSAALAWGGPDAPQLIRVAAVWLARPGRPGRGGPRRPATPPGSPRGGQRGRPGDRVRPGRRPAPRPAARSRSASTAAAGWPGPRPSGAAPRATTTRPPGRPCWTSSAPASATRRRGPGGGWPRRWPRRAAATRPQHQWQLAVAAADQLGAAPLRRALADLGRRLGLSRGSAGLGRRRRGARARAAGRADRPRGRGAAAAGGRPLQPGDRRGAVHRAQDGQRARVQHPGQAGRRPAGPRPRPSRTATGWRRDPASGEVWLATGSGWRPGLAGGSGWRAGSGRGQRGPLAGRRQGVQELGRPGRGRGRVGVGRADLRVPVQVVEELGDALARQALRRPPGSGRSCPTAAAGGPPARTAARPARTTPRQTTRSAAGSRPAAAAASWTIAISSPIRDRSVRLEVTQPSAIRPDPLQRRPGQPAQQDRRAARLHRLGCLVASAAPGRTRR